MSCPNIHKFSTFLAHQHPQDAQVRPLHHACIAREEAQRPATQPVAHVGLSGWTHRGKCRAAGLARPMRGAPNSCAGQRPLLRTLEAPTLYAGDQEKLTRRSQTGGTRQWGERRQSRRRLNIEKRERKDTPFLASHPTLSLWTLLWTVCQPCNTLQAGAVLSLGNVVPSVGTTIPIRQQVPRTGGPAPPRPDGG